MARTKQEIETEQHIVTVEDAKGLPALSAAATELAGADAVIMSAEEALKMVGRIEAADFLATVAEKMIAETAITLKQSKQYKGLPYKDKDGKWQHVATFAEFCEYKLGKRRRRVDQLIDNYNLLGPELYEQAERIGFRQRDYAALKALPTDDRQLIAQAIEEENLDKALDLMQHMAVKHQAYKDTSEKKITELGIELENMEKSKDAVIQKKDQKLNELDHELESLKLDRPVFAHIDWPVAFKGYLEQLAITRKNLKHALGSLDVIREAAMKIEPQSEDEEAALTQAREILATELVGIHNESAEMLAALGMSFDRSLGAYSDARINLLQV